MLALCENYIGDRIDNFKKYMNYLNSLPRKEKIKRAAIGIGSVYLPALAISSGLAYADPNPDHSFIDHLSTGLKGGLATGIGINSYIMYKDKKKLGIE